jgi:hypothetical protein
MKPLKVDIDLKLSRFFFFKKFESKLIFSSSSMDAYSFSGLGCDGRVFESFPDPVVPEVKRSFRFSEEIPFSVAHFIHCESDQTWWCS